METCIEYKKLCDVPRTAFNRRGIILAKEVDKNIKVDDKDVSFVRMNRFLKRNNHVTEYEFRQLEYVREERNKIHLQGLSEPDTGYTKQKLQRVTRPIGFLSSKL